MGTWWRGHIFSFALSVVYRRRLAGEDSHHHGRTSLGMQETRHVTAVHYRVSLSTEQLDCASARELRKLEAWYVAFSITICYSTDQEHLGLVICKRMKYLKPLRRSSRERFHQSTHM